MNGRLPLTVAISALISSIALTGTVLVYYFNGQGALIDRLNTVETRINDRISAADAQLSDRLGKLEVREAVGEQHAVQTDAIVTDTRNNFNAFEVDIRAQLQRIQEGLGELKPLIQNRRGR